MTVRLAELRDLDTLLELVPEVEPLFGPMPEFAERAARALCRGTAFVSATDNGRVLGAALLSPDDEPHHIHWLAVRQSARGRGVGRALLGAIVDRWPTGDISVTTFTADEPAGLPARRLYTSSGFTCEGPCQPGPDGGARDLFVLRR